MRVLVLAPRYPLDGELFGDAVAEQVAALGATHEIRVQSLGPLSVPRGSSRGITVYSADGDRVRRLVAIAARHLSWRPDVIWSLWGYGNAAPILAGVFRRPFVVSLLGGEVANLPALAYGGARKRLDRLRLRVLLRAAKAVTVGSRWLGARLAEVDPAVRPIEAPIGIRAERVPVRTRAPWRQGPLRICSVVDANPLKGAEHIFRALAWLRDRGVAAELTVFTLGPEESRRRLRAMAEVAEIAAWLHLSPPLAAREFYRSLPEFDVLISASVHESQGLSMIEAALAEVPVVAPDVGVAGQLAQMGAAHLVRSLSAEALGAAVLDAARGAPRSRSRVASQFGIEACTPRFERALERAAGSGEPER